MVCAAAVAVLSAMARPYRPPRACSLLAPTEITRLLSASMGPGVTLESTKASMCKWVQQGVEASQAVSVVISTAPAAAYESEERRMPPERVAGIGDNAYLTGRWLSYTMLSVRKGRVAMTVMVRGLKSVAALQSAEKTIGRAAVAKL